MNNFTNQKNKYSNKTSLNLAYRNNLNIQPLRSIPSLSLAVAIGITTNYCLADEEKIYLKDTNALYEEIMVTATKRETRLQDTAMSISTLGAETIEKRDLVSMGDYLSTIPGVTIQDRGTGAVSIVTRGIAANPQREGDTTGVYFGEIPVAGMSSAGNQGSGDLRMVDIERVEVLKGPQGTLYGADAMGGIVRIIPAAPNLEQMEGKVATQYSSTGELGGDNTSLEGVFNLPVIENTLALRGVAYQINNSGYYKSVAPVDMGGNNGNLFALVNAYGARAQIKDDIGADETTGIRLTALWQPLESLSVSLGHTWQKIEQDGLPETELKLPGEFLQTRLLPGPALPALNGVKSEPEGYVDDLNLTSLVVDYDLSWGTLHSASSWIDREAARFIDVAFAYGNLPAFGPWATENDVFAQEIRFQSQFEGPVQLLAGAYYEDREGSSSLIDSFSGDPAKAADALADTGWIECCLSPDAPDELRESYYVADETEGSIRQKAVFAELSYDMTNQLTATVGVRHFEYDGESSVFESGFWVGSVTPIQLSSLENDFSDETWKANLSWKPNEDTLFYMQWAEGFRLGGAQAPKPDICDADGNGAYEIVGGGEVEPGNIDPDNTENIELGYKTSLADNHISLNAALYRINWEGMPVAHPLTSCYGTYSENAGKSISQGVELDSRLFLTDNLRLDFSASYNEAKLDGDSNLGEDGTDLPGSADINLSAGLEYAFSLSGYDAFARVDYAYVGEYTTYIDQPASIPSSGDYSQVHLKAGATIGKVNVDVFVNNLTNANELTWVEAAYGQRSAPRAYRLRPRTVGLNLSYRF